MFTTLIASTIVFLTIVTFGVVAPELVSASSNILVILGFVSIPSTLIAIGYLIKMWKDSDEGRYIINKIRDSE